MRDLGQHVALQVDSTALAAHLGQEAAHRGCQARVLIRDHELDAAETTLQEFSDQLFSDSSGPSVMPRSRRWPSGPTA